jgi:hypothetical protein
MTSRQFHLWVTAPATLATLLTLSLARPALASLFGEENLTLLRQLTELLQIHDELVRVSHGVVRTADAVEDVVHMASAARAAVDELKGYSIDRFLGDVQKDLYHTYPGAELLLEGSNSRRVAKWQNSHAQSPATTYEMIGAVFGDLSAPLKKRGRDGGLRTERAYIVRAEAAGALALAHQAETWTQAADEDAAELARLSRDAGEAQAQHLSARALALIAVQNSHIIRLLARGVRTDGIKGALDWGQRAEGMNNRDALNDGVNETLGSVDPAPKMLAFPSLFDGDGGRP